MVTSLIERAARMYTGKRQRRGASQADTDSDSDPVATAVDSVNTRMNNFLKEDVRELAARAEDERACFHRASCTI